MVQYNLIRTIQEASTNFHKTLSQAFSFIPTDTFKQDSLHNVPRNICGTILL